MHQCLNITPQYLQIENPVVSERELTFSLKNPFDSVLILANAQTKTTGVLADRPSWLPQLDAFRTLVWRSIKQEIHSMKNYFLSERAKAPVAQI